MSADTFHRAGTRMSIPKRTRRSSKTLAGFDYALGKPVSRSTAEWRQKLRELVSHGGRRRHEHGETYGHGRDSLIEFEIYGNINL